MGNLDDFTRSYLATALWSSQDLETEISFDETHDISDFSPEFIRQAKEDCKDFQESNELALSEHSPSQGGHDFWLTRNLHGAGFWDGDWKAGDALTDAAHVYGSLDIYLEDDGKIYG